MNDTLPPEVEATDESRLKATWRAYWRIWLALVVVIAIIAGVIAWAVLSAPANTPAAKGRGGFDPNARPLPVVAAPARKGNIDVRIDALGTVTPRNMVVVHSRVDGQLMSVAFREGQTVKAGDLLAQIDPRPFEVQLTQANGQMARDQAQLKNAQVDLERYRTLLTQDSISKQQVDTQEALVRQYQGAVQSDQGAIDNARLQITYARIVAPISGRVGLRQVDPGNMVHASDSNGLVTITQVQPITVIYPVPEDNVPRIVKRVQSRQEVAVEAFDRSGKNKLATGRLLTFDNQIDFSQSVRQCAHGRRDEAGRNVGSVRCDSTRRSRNLRVPGQTGSVRRHDARQAWRNRGRKHRSAERGRSGKPRRRRRRRQAA
jgi:multidrug efflux system membrane fusion protein